MPVPLTLHHKYKSDYWPITTDFTSMFTVNYSTLWSIKTSQFLLCKLLHQKLRCGGQYLHYFVATLFMALYGAIWSESADFYRRYDANFRLLFIGTRYSIYEEHNFQVLQGSAETIFRWGGKITTVWLQIYSGIQNTNNYENRLIFDWVICKIQPVTFPMDHSMQTWLP